MAAFRQQKFRTPGKQELHADGNLRWRSCNNGDEWGRIGRLEEATSAEEENYEEESGKWRVAGGWWTFMVTEFSRL